MIKNIVYTIIMFLSMYYGSYNVFANDLEMDNNQKILLICMDGATWNIMQPLINEGQLPNLSKLIENGAHGELLSEPEYSPPSWTSIATGKIVEKHGVVDFFSAYERKARYIWSILSDFKIKVGVTNWKMALPEEVNGFMYIRSLYRDRIMRFFPPKLKSELKENGVKIIKEKKPLTSKDNIYRLFGIFEDNDMDVSLYLIDRYRPDFTALGFLASDIYQHRFWSALEPRYFDINKAEISKNGSLITDFYKKIDSFLEYFIKNNYSIIFVSDHGQCRNDKMSGLRIAKHNRLYVNFLINIMLEKVGFLTFVPKWKDGGQIDFSKSQAYFNNNYSKKEKGIKINREIVKGNRIVELREKITSILKEAHFETGENVFINVKENDPNNDTEMIDVTFMLNPIFRIKNISFQEDSIDDRFFAFRYLLNKKGEKLTKIILGGEEYDLGKFINLSLDGVHEKEGVIIMTGKNIRKNKIIKGAKTFDITPTILYLFGLPVAKDMDGTVLYEAIEPEFIKNNAVKYVDTYETINLKITPEESISDKELEETKERLRSLGYAR